MLCFDSDHHLVGVLTGAALARLLADLAMFGCVQYFHATKCMAQLVPAIKSND